MRKAFHLTLSEAGPSPETRLCWILVSFQRFPGSTSSTLPEGSGRHPSVRSHQLWHSLSGSCTGREGCQGKPPDSPGCQSLPSRWAGFGLARPALLQTTEGLHQRTPRVDSSEKQKVDSPRGVFSISRAYQGLLQHAGSCHLDCRPHPRSELCAPKEGTAEVRFVRLTH